MIALLQRVKKASVSVEKKPVSSIGKGYLILLGVHKEDTSADAKKLADKIINLRIMDDGMGKMNLSIQESGGEILSVSQFTLCANLKGGRRPDLFPAMESKAAETLYNLFTDFLRLAHISVKTGRYANYMEVDLTNDGPVTFILDSRSL